MRMTLAAPCALFGLLLSTAIGARAQSQANAITIGETVQVRSEILKQSRSLTISKPSGYDSSTDRYPVLYLLDSESNFEYTAAVVHFLSDAGRIPEMLVVAINSGEIATRTHDLTPPSQAEIDNRFSPGNGGADDFLKFIGDELVPYIERNFRTRPYRILAGHSFGGLFTIHALVTRPKLFNAYIAIDPTVSWNNAAEIVRFEQFISQTKDLPVDLFITAANEFGTATAGVRRLASVLDGKTPTGLRWNFEWMKEENHISVPLRSLYSGLDTIFDGWHLADPLRLYDEGGLEAIHRHFSEGAKRYGYERNTPAFTIALLVAGLAKKGRLEEASAVLLHDPKNYPPPWNQLDALARAYADRGNVEQAIRYYKLSLERNPQNEWARKKLAEMGAGTNASANDGPH